MEFHQIRYFLAACDHGSFTRAAEACHVSQPALTVAIRKLEDELGGSLFLRASDGVRLTDLGRTMRTHLARIEETRTAAERAARAARGPEREVVNIGIYSTIGPGSICGAITAFRAQEASVRLVLYDVWGKRAHELLLSGAFDCAIVARHGEMSDRLDALPLYSEPMVLAMAPGHPLATGPLDAGHLAGVTYLDRLRCEYRERILSDLESLGVAPAAIMGSEPEDWVQSAVAAGEGVTILPRDQVILPGIVTREVAGLDYVRVIELLTVRGREISPAARRLVDFLASRDWEGDTRFSPPAEAAREGR